MARSWPRDDRALELPFDLDVANDPFFGRAGRMLAASQRDQELKFELLVPINSDEKPTACLSFNYHQDHFGALWGIETGDRRHGPYGLRRLRHGARRSGPLPPPRPRRHFLAEGGPRRAVGRLTCWRARDERCSRI